MKTFAAHNCYGVAAITALTVQNTQGAMRQTPAEPKMLEESLAMLFADGRIRAVKIGMLANRANVEIVAKALDGHGDIPVVLDPVIRSASGLDLLDARGLEALRSDLLKRTTIVTPNLAEAAALTGLKVDSVEMMKLAAQKMIELGAKAVVVTGGHLEKAVDVFSDGATTETFAADHVKPDNTHGTGCAYSSAVAANLALGRHLHDAVMLAKVYVTEAIRKAYSVGPGRMPLNHFFRSQQAPRAADLSPAPSEAEPAH